MSENPEDGDFHAFPTSSVDGFTQHGMTIRDYFAGQVLMGLGCRAENPEYRLKQARIAYDWADAMLKARQTPPPSTEEATPVERGRSAS